MGLSSLRVTALRRREQHPNLIAAWNFNEGSGTVARDSVNSHNLTVGAALTWPAGHSGGGTALANSNASATAHVAWNSLTALPMTIMGWVRPTNLATDNHRALFGIFDTTDASGSTMFALWAQRPDFGTTNVLQGNARINGSLTAINNTALTLNTWVHVALSYDGTTLRLFRNGVEVATVVNAGTLSNGNFFFSIAPAATGSPSHAQVDDVRVFNTVFSATQIATFMGDPVAPR